MGKKGLVHSDSSCILGLCLGPVHVKVHCSCPQTLLSTMKACGGAHHQMVVSCLSHAWPLSLGERTPGMCCIGGNLRYHR